MQCKDWEVRTMATAKLRDVRITDVRDAVLRLQPCGDAEEWLCEQLDDTPAIMVWRATPLEYLEWLFERLDLRLSLGYHAIYDAQCHQARAALDAAIDPAEAAYHDAVAASRLLEGLDEKRALLEKAQGERVQAGGAAYHLYHMVCQRAEDRLYTCMKSYKAFSAAYKALMALSL
jgi:hypothetical protein